MITFPYNTAGKITISAPQQPVKNIVPRIGVSVAEAAEAIGVSEPMVYILIKEKKIRSVKVGKRTVVSVRSLRTFVNGKKKRKKNADCVDYNSYSMGCRREGDQ